MPEEEEIEIISKRTGKPKTKSGNKAPARSQKNTAAILEDGDNTKFLKVNMKLLDFPPVDMHDYDSVKHRLLEYFQLYTENDMKPTVAGMAMALGYSRRELWCITHDQAMKGRYHSIKLPEDVTALVKNAYHILENLWETYMNSGKINPMAGVFLGVNNYEYQDVKKVELAPTSESEDTHEQDISSIRERYIDVEYTDDDGVTHKPD